MTRFGVVVAAMAAAITLSSCTFDSSNPGVAALGAGPDAAEGEPELLVIDERERWRRDTHELEGMLVTEAAMPKDWRYLPDDQLAEVDVALQTCAGSGIRELAHGAPHAEVAFGRYDTGVVGIAEAKGPPEALLVSGLWRFGSEAEAAAFVSDVAAAFSACAQEPTVTVDVTTLQLVIEPEQHSAASARSGTLGADGIRVVTVAGPEGDPPQWTRTGVDTTRFGSTVVQVLRTETVSDLQQAGLDHDSAARTLMCDTARSAAAGAGGDHDLAVCDP